MITDINKTMAISIRIPMVAPGPWLPKNVRNECVSCVLFWNRYVILNPLPTLNTRSNIGAIHVAKKANNIPTGKDFLHSGSMVQKYIISMIDKDRNQRERCIKDIFSVAMIPFGVGFDIDSRNILPKIRVLKDIIH